MVRGNGGTRAVRVSCRVPAIGGRGDDLAVRGRGGGLVVRGRGGVCGVRGRVEVQLGGRWGEVPCLVIGNGEIDIF